MEEHTLKTALKAQMLPRTAVAWHTILSALPPSKGEKPSEPWSLLEVEHPLTHSLLRTSAPSQGSDGISAVALHLVTSAQAGSAYGNLRDREQAGHWLLRAH